ncbi:transcription initiation factor IIF, beta subunit-domain-containing protein [Blastocladiella britannica]|nr:transcription initiation factor IIF, beta subunit-domain-containing protein [Blastocladiella britannica]
MSSRPVPPAATTAPATGVAPPGAPTKPKFLREVLAETPRFSLASRSAASKGPARPSALLVKVPKWLADEWRAASPGTSLGSLMCQHARPVTKYAVELHDVPTAAVKLPRSFTATPVPIPTTFAFSELATARGRSDHIEAYAHGEMSLTPSIKDPAYIALSRARSAPKKQTLEAISADQHIKNQMVEGLYSNGNQPAHRVIASAQPVRREGVRLTKTMSRADLRTTLITLLREYTYWDLKTLQERTQEPMTYLKEVLNEVAVHVTRGPYQHKWTMKPELRESLAKSAEADEDVSMDVDGAEK